MDKSIVMLEQNMQLVLLCARFLRKLFVNKAYLFGVNRTSNIVLNFSLGKKLLNI